jgi:hypothetical protein
MVHLIDAAGIEGAEWAHSGAERMERTADVDHRKVRK